MWMLEALIEHSTEMVNKILSLDKQEAPVYFILHDINVIMDLNMILYEDL